MNRIDQLFQQQKRDILSIYFCAGAPTPDGTVPTLQALEQAGVNLVEIGIPFSDPMADGPVIQDAATTALRGGMSLERLFAQLRDVRQTVSIPLILMGYLNVIYRFGFERFCQQCVACGIDGMIIPDLPFDEYMAEYKATAERYDLRVIMLITPETSEERIRLIDMNTRGFIYQVSTDATTGAQSSFSEETLSYFRRIEGMKLSNPTLVGFGISSHATYSAACQHSAGGIVGSKFVKLLAEHPTDPTTAITLLKQALQE